MFTYRITLNCTTITLRYAIQKSQKQGNNKDFVEPTLYPKITKITVVSELPNDCSPPLFKPLLINNSTPYRKPNLPPGLDDSDIFKIFRLFFIDKLIDLLIYYTNANIRKA